MPNRILRDWTDSALIDKLSFQEEVLFTRLIMKADDYGNFYRDPVIIKSLLFPRKDGLRSSDIDSWLTKLEAASLIRVYPAKGDSFLHIENFNQRLRQSRRTFPEEPKINDNNLSATCPQLVDNFPLETKRNESETESESETKAEKNKVKYADFVQMTDEEYSKLINDHGEEFAAACVNELNNYKGAHGKKYKSDYRAILSWVIDKLKSKQNGTKNYNSKTGLKSHAAQPCEGKSFGKF